MALLVLVKISTNLPTTFPPVVGNGSLSNNIGLYACSVLPVVLPVFPFKYGFDSFFNNWKITSTTQLNRRTFRFFCATTYLFTGRMLYEFWLFAGRMLYELSGRFFKVRRWWFFLNETLARIDLINSLLTKKDLVIQEALLWGVANLFCSGIVIGLMIMSIDEMNFTCFCLANAFSFAHLSRRST